LVEKALLKPRSVFLFDIVHNERSAYIRAGYGARPISEWPFYKFILLYIRGFEEQSVKEWTDWLVGQFHEFKTTPKSEGGMFRGSVHRFASQRSCIDTLKVLESPALLTEEDVIYGVQVLIRQRLDVIDSIRVNGYCPGKSDKIFAVKKGDKIVFQGGHHRAAALYALNYKRVPQVFVYPKYLWRIRKWLKKT
jgi:hypothetical protein